MRLPPVLLFSVSVGSIALACGGSAEQDVLSESSSSSTSSSSSGNTASSSGTTSSSGATTSGSSSGGSTTDDGGTKPPLPTTCTPEKELNNGPEQANELEGSVCGTLLPSSELDFLTFTLKEGTKTMDFTFSGNVKITIAVEGEDKVELSPQSNPPIPFVVGKPYIVRISSNGGAAAKVDWRVNLVTS